MNIWYWIMEEFKALGLRCVTYGPEFWLVGPLAGSVIVAVIVGLIVGRRL